MWYHLSIIAPHNFCHIYTIKYVYLIISSMTNRLLDIKQDYQLLIGTCIEIKFKNPLNSTLAFISNILRKMLFYLMFNKWKRIIKYNNLFFVYYNFIKLLYLIRTIITYDLTKQILLCSIEYKQRLAGKNNIEDDWWISKFFQKFKRASAKLNRDTIEKQYNNVGKTRIIRYNVLCSSTIYFLS